MNLTARQLFGVTVQESWEDDAELPFRVAVEEPEPDEARGVGITVDDRIEHLPRFARNSCTTKIIYPRFPSAPLPEINPFVDSLH